MPDRQEGRRYVWASREDRQLNRRESGDWVYYISPGGQRYGRCLRAVSMPYDYMEHVTGELKTVTYWGKRAG